MEAMEPTHGVTHWDPEGCWGCKIRTVQVAPSATPTRSPGAARQKQDERKLDQDLAAYKRMRRSGLQPHSTKGAAELEQRAESSFEVNSGQLAADKAKGKDASRGGKEWRRRSEEAYDAVRRGEQIEVTA
jgi:hypothetical protein